MSDPCAISFDVPNGYRVERGNPGWTVFHGSVPIQTGLKTENMGRMYASAHCAGVASAHHVGWMCESNGNPKGKPIFTQSQICAETMENARLDGEPWWQVTPIYAISQPDPHPDDLAVDRFAAKMKAKMAAARTKGRGGWSDPESCSETYLAQLLIEHLPKGNQGTFEDIANFAMMLHQREADPVILADAFHMNQKGIFTGLRDRNGQPIHIGDELEFDRYEWGGDDNRFVIEFVDGELQVKGTVFNIGEWCHIVKKWNEK